MERFSGFLLMLVLCALAVISYRSKHIIVSFICFFLFVGLCIYDILHQKKQKQQVLLTVALLAVFIYLHVLLQKELGQVQQVVVLQEQSEEMWYCPFQEQYLVMQVAQFQAVLARCKRKAIEINYEVYYAYSHRCYISSCRTNYFE